MKYLVVAVASLFVAACASSGANLQIASAGAIGNNTNPDSVVVSDVERGVTTVRWNATANGVTYACAADDMVRRPVCTRPN